jgi:TRAP-type C4-dicarboxylate transport system substrate-binding protein
MHSLLFTTVRKRCAFALLCALVVSMSGPAQAESLQKLRIVGGLAGINQYVNNEEPFWTKELSRLSNGKYTAEIVPFDRAGVPGGDMLRMIQLGVIPFGTVLMSSLSAQYPEYTGPDLAGLNPDMASLRKSVTAYRPYLEKSLRERHGIEMLAIYVYPAQVVFCKRPLSSLADLANRRTRVSSATQADFVSALGGVTVLIPLAQIMTNMTSGNTECAITGTMTGNTLGLHEVTTHVHPLPVSWGMAMFGANASAWNGLAPELKALLARELPKLETAIWTVSEHETTMGMRCNKGDASCVGGRKGSMVEVPLSAQDERRRQEILASQVLPRWLQRCNAKCADIWNQTIGPARGVMAGTTPAPK